MDIRKCKICGRLFQYKGSKYCPSCVIELDNMYLKVRDYIYEHPDANVMEVSRETGVDEDIILEFLKEGRLELKRPSLLLKCERCDKPITAGRMCTECLAEFERKMKKGFKIERRVSAGGSKSQKMHAAEFIKKKKGD